VLINRDKSYKEIIFLLTLYKLGITGPTVAETLGASEVAVGEGREVAAMWPEGRTEVWVYEQMLGLIVSAHY
jgi:hypothetical protein